MRQTRGAAGVAEAALIRAYVDREPVQVDELAAGMASMARDASARQAMGARARAVALERFDARDAARRYLSLFQEVGACR